MPLFLERQENNFRIEIWKMDEDVDELLSKSTLSPSELTKLESFQSSRRKKEWLCVRRMVNKTPFLPYSAGTTGKSLAIVYDEDGKPHLEDSDQRISISHTKNFVGVILSETLYAGVDLEILNPRIEKIAHRFLSDDEKKRTPATNPLPYYYIVWGAKEVLYKIHGRGGLLFSENLLTDAFEVKEKGMIKASIHSPGKAIQWFEVHYEFIDDLLLTYSVR